MENAVETFSLTKVFSDCWGRSRVRAVDDLNFRVRHNEIFGLLGPNGSGKTTTIKMLLGLLYPTKGKAILLGGDSTDPKISSRIGFLPEESYLYKYLNARETLNFYGNLFALPSKVRKMRTEALLDMVGLKAVANRPVGTYSKGMARRIGLAQALINDPDLLILDEPTTGLDPIGTRQIKDLLIELAKRGKTILLCSHLLADVEDVCDRIAILYGGRIQSEGNVRDLLQQTDKKQITTGNISDAVVQEIRHLLQSHGTYCTITSPMDKLESFFIKTVLEAQKQAQPTSGAVSTTQIGDFLASKATEESPQAAILDKLVSEPASEPSSVLPAAATKSVEAGGGGEPARDEQLLSQLTNPSEPVEPKPVSKTEPVETTQESDQEETKKNILDELTGRSKPQQNQTNQTDDSNGDPSDA